MQLRTRQDTFPAGLPVVLLFGTFFVVGCATSDKGVLATKESAPSSKDSAPSTTYKVAGRELSSPVTIIGATILADGGSIVFKLKDVTGRELGIESYTPFVIGDTEQERNRKARELWHINAGGRQLKPGGPDELELQRLLNDCVAYAHESGRHLVEPDPQFANTAWSPEAGEKTVQSFQGRLAREIQESKAGKRAPGRSRAN